MRIGDCNTGVDLAVPGSDLTIETIVEVVEPARDGEPAVYRITVPERKTDPDTRRLFEELQRIGRDAQPVTLPPGPGQEFELIDIGPPGPAAQLLRWMSEEGAGGDFRRTFNPASGLYLR